MNASRRQIRAILAGGLVASLSGCGCGHLEGADAGAGKVGVAHLEFTKGAVTLTRDGKEQPAQLGYVFAHDALVTGDDGEARIRFVGGRTLHLDPNSQFVLDENAGGLVLNFPRGSLRAEMGEGGAGSRDLSIQTPFGVTQLGTGQNGVDLKVSNESTTVSVLLGKVELLDNQGGRTEARAGERIALSLGRVVKVGKEDQPAIDLPPLEVVIRETGAALLKKKGQRAWGPLKPGDKLAEGDALRVQKGRSLLAVADSTVAAPAGTELSFGGAGRDGTVETTRVDLTKGALALNLATGKRTRVKVGAYELESSTGGQFNVAKTPDGYEIAALTGDVTASKEGAEAQRVAAGEVARLTRRGNDLRGASAGEVVLPSHPGIKVYHSGSIGEATLSWPGEKKDYFVEVAYDAEYRQKIASGVVHQPFITVDAPSNASLHWRVYDAEHTNVLDRGFAAFRSETTANPTGPTTNTVKEGSDKTTIIYQGTVPAITLACRKEPGAERYRVRVFRAGDLAAPVVDRTEPGELVKLEAGTLTEGSYLWSATPLSATAQELRGGKMTKLDIEYMNAVPGLQVRSPKSGDPLLPRVRAAGVAQVGARVSVNGKPLVLDEKGRFDEPVSTGGHASVVFRLSRAKEADVVVVRRLGRGAR